MTDSQLTKLAIPFPPRLVRANQGGGVYVRHHLYAQRLLLHLGGYDFEVAQVLRGEVAAITPDPKASSKRGKEGRPALHDAVVGVIARLTVTIDGRRVVIEEAGDCEDPHNWPHDGARMKDAMSDALKRCCARIGLGLHLYCEDEEYMLLDSLRKQEADENADTQPPANVDSDTGELRAVRDGNDYDPEDHDGRPF